MRVLIGCEYSAVVRDAFRARGHDAWSADLLPTEGDPRWHIQGDILDVLDNGWDLAIFHPTCTYLSNSGVRWLWHSYGETKLRNSERMAKVDEAAKFFAKLYSAPIPRIAVENPIMHGYGKSMIVRALERPTGMPMLADADRFSPSQVIQPWMFGHGETKATCLWLKNLPKLTPTDIVAGREARVHRMAPGADRWKERSRTLPGIAAAMAAQWERLGELRYDYAPEAGR